MGDILVIIPILSVYTIWVCLSCMWALNTGDALYQASIQIVCLGLVCAICYNKINISVIQRSIVLVATIVGAYGLSQWLGYDFVTISWKGNVPVSTIGNPNFLASFLICCIPAVLALVRAHLLYLIPMVIQVMCLVATGCRGAWVGLCVGLLAFEKRLVWLSCMIAIPLLVILVQPEFVKSHLDHGNSIYGRISLWQNTAEIVRKYPIGGVGIGNFYVHYPKYMYSTGELTPIVNDTTVPKKPHNMLLQILAETGFIGLCLFVSFLWHVLKDGTKYRHKWVTVGVLALLVHGLFSFPLDITSTRMLFYLYVGLIAKGEI